MILCSLFEGNDLRKDVRMIRGHLSLVGFNFEV